MNIGSKALAALFSLFFLVSAGVPTLAQEDLCAMAGQAVKAAADIRGLAKKAPIPCEVHNREQVKQYMLQTVEKKITPERLRREEQMFKYLGLIPEDMDYLETVLDLYLSQVAAYYDPELNRFVMAEWLPAGLQYAIAVHEATHALQDQYFDLGSFTDMSRHSTDVLLARMALVEGDALAVQTDFTSRQMGQKGPLSGAQVQSVVLQSVLGGSAIAGAQGVPPGLVAMMIFPYASGLRFVHGLLERGGYEQVDQAFKRPPRSTEEILHPEKYWQAEADFIPPTAERWEAIVPEGHKIAHRDTLGQFILATWLKEVGLGDLPAIAASQGWGGDEVALIEGAEGDAEGSAEKNPVELVWLINWDDAAAADNFSQALLSLLSQDGGQAGAEAFYPWQEQRLISLKQHDRETKLRIKSRAS